MATVTSTGLGSGIDINSIVGAFVDAEIDPQTTRITEETAESTAQISAYGLLNAELSEFKSSYKELGYSSTFSAATSTSSDNDILDAKLGVGAATGQWNFQVSQLAQAQTLVSKEEDGFSAVTDSVGVGSLELSFGSYNAAGDTFTLDATKAIESIVINNDINPETNSSNNSLEGLRDTINEGDYSVSASIMNDGNAYRMILTNKSTGEENSVQIIAKDAAGVAITNGTLDRFNYSATDKKLDESISAQDAKFTMSGIDISSATNEVNNVIQGVTLNLNSADIGKTVSLKIDTDTTKVEEQINAFIENYNSTLSKINELTSYGGEDDTSGILNGDSTVRAIKDMMRGVLNTLVDNTGSSVHSFADLGILSNKTDGSLELNEKDFAAVLESDMQGVADFFTSSGSATDSFITFDNHTSVTKAGSYDVNVSQLATQGSFKGASAPSFPVTIDDDNDNFTLKLDGFSSVGSDPANPYTITLSPGDYSLAELATELQSKINSVPNFVANGVGVNVTEDPDNAGHLLFTSSSYGSSSIVSFLTVDPDFLDELGIGVQTGIAGNDIQGTIDGEIASGNGQYLLSKKGDSTGIKLLIEGGGTGDRGIVSYAEPMTTRMTSMLVSIIDASTSDSTVDINTSDGLIDTKMDTFYKRLAELDEQTETLATRKAELEARLYTQYNAMDIAVANMNSTMSALEGMLDSLPGYTHD